MHKNLVSIKNKLTAFYLIIISIVILGSLGLFSVMSIRNTQERWLNDLDHSAQMLADYLGREDLRIVNRGPSDLGVLQGELTAEEYEMMLALESVVSIKENEETDVGMININKLVNISEKIIGKDNYVMYAFKADGEFVVPRSYLNGDNPTLWSKHQSKLIYEVLKQKDGWSYYPKKDKWSLRSKSHVVRYFTISELNLFVCLEGIQESNLSLLKEYFDLTILIILLIILFASFLVFRFITNWHLVNTEKDLHLNEKDSLQIKMNEKIQSPIAKNIDVDSIVIEKDELMVENEPEISKEQVNEIEAGSVGVFNKEAIAENDVVFESKEEEVFVRTQSSKININDVKSPLLKKLLEDIRKS